MDRSIARGMATAAALCAALVCSAPASAQGANEQTLPAGPSPVIRLQARSADVTIRTWDRPEVQLSSSEPVQARHFGPKAVERAIPGGDVPIFATTVNTPGGEVHLQPEDFPVDGIAGSPHDGVVIFGGDADAIITVTVPANSALLLAMIGRGAIHVSGYHGAMVTRLHNGTIDIAHSSGEAYVEAARGNIVITKSGFSRIRARTAIGNIFFSGCNVRQIEVSSIRGRIAYDNGTFAPGLARFETQQGNIALGVAAGGLQIGAHSSSGHIVAAFDRGAGTMTGSATDAQATVNGGGPVVTVNAGKGTVFLYNGSFRGNPRVRRHWSSPRPVAGPKARTCAKRRCRP